tara:strand:+ start:324 stop:695 length:372 start_codon:yes stop_codon:yes gene_type:complete
MKFNKNNIKQEIRKILKEAAPYLSNMKGPSDGHDYVGMKTKGPYEEADVEEPPFEQFSSMVPAPRARVSDIESHKKVYGYLMGHPGAAMKMSVEDLMAQLEAGCPMSTAQALADYLADRAKLK